MVKSQLRKSTFREIKSSLGRFLSIMAIIGLGVGFFAGLKIARQAMVATMEDYLGEHAFYDYRLLSTLGFDQEAVDYLAGQGGAAAAEGALAFDVLYRLESVLKPEQGDETVVQGAVKVHSLTEQLNTVQLTAGRMPSSDFECVVDSKLFGEEELGSVLVFTQENDRETLEHFTYQEYTIVGMVQSPLYIQYERGNTSLGTGRLDGYIYLPTQGFAEDYYTEIYVTFEEEYGLYSNAYKDYLDAVETGWEELADRAADLRYQKILDDADQELADAHKELEEKTAEGETELADAEKELDDARQKLLDGQQALEDAQAELLDGEQTLLEKTQELNDAQETVAEKEAELQDGEEKLQEGIDQWNSSNSSLQSARGSLNQQKAELAEQKAQVAEQKANLEAAMAGFQSLEEVENRLQQAQEGLALAESSIADLDGRLEQIGGESVKAALKERIDQLEKSGGSEDELKTLREQLQAFDILEGAKAEAEAQKAVLEAGILELGEARAYLQAQLAGVDPQQVQVGLQTIAAYEAQIASGEAQIASYETQLNSGARELASAWEEIENTRKKIEEGRQALEDARAEIEEGKQALADAEKELQDARDTLAEKEAELADAWAEYEDGQQAYLDAQTEFQEKIAEAEKELADAEAELADLEPPETYVLGRDTNVGYVCFENDSGIVEGIANIFPVFFILVAALVCITTMNRMVEEQRTQIGVLKALGYSEGAIMSKYLVYSGLAAVAGCVVGFLLGTWVFPQVIWAAYGIMYKAQPLLYVFDWKLALIAMAVSLLCSLGTTWLSCRVELSQVAAQLMRPKAPKSGKRVFLERVPFVWNHLSFLRKVSLRNIFRYKKRLFMMVLGISGCTALLVTGFGIKDSIADIASVQFQKIQVFDLAVALQDPADANTLEDLNGLEEQGVEEYLCVMEKNMDLVTEAGIKSIVLISGEPEQMPDFVDLHTGTGETIGYPGTGEAVLSDKLAADYGITVGDVIILRDEDMNSLKLKVMGICENYIYNYVYISEDAWENQMGGAPARKTVYVNAAEASDVHETAAALAQMDNVSNVTVNQDTMERVGSMMASLNIIVVAVILSAAGLAFIVLYNLTNINITERIREIATIKVLGFYRNETAAYVFRENLLLSIMGMAVGLILGKFLHAFVMSQIQIDMISFDVRVKGISYVYSGLLTIGFAWFVGKTMGGKLERISMTESLKSVD